MNILEIKIKQATGGEKEERRSIIEILDAMKKKMKKF
jgi:hypothetical protein